ncbi:MAG TPA: SIMPL domain-containing protein [Novosphingobium sp.]|nr:SIMPL domain-containing protein [Novosphingobium sp.]
MRTIALALFVLSLAGCGETPPDPRGVDHDETLLSLSASGEAEAVPDEAFIELGVNSYAREARAAQTANTKKIEDIVAALADLGVAAKDTQTRNLSLQKIDYGANKGQYQASNILRVRVREASRAGEAVTRATEAGANVLAGPSLRIADPEKANRGAYIAAYRAARTRAQAYADAAGMEIARVLTIRDGGQGGGYPPPYYPVAEQAMAVDAVAAPVAAPPPPSIRPGTTLTRVSVQVDFALREK